MSLAQHEKIPSETLGIWLFLLRDALLYTIEQVCPQFKERGVECLFQNPRLMISCFYTEHQGKIGLYPEQIEFINVILDAVLGGIRVFESTFLTSHQLYKMMSLFSELRFLFSGNELVFGTNIDGLTHLFISESFGKKASRNVLYQLIGRVGRMGHSYEARVMTTLEECLQQIFEWRQELDQDTDSP